MRVGRGVVAIVGLVVATSSARAEPKPKPVDVKTIKDPLVLQDVKGGTYVVSLADTARIFYGTGTQLYEQLLAGPRTKTETSWSVSTIAPRLPNVHFAAIGRSEDDTYKRVCDGLDDMVLTLVTGDKAKQILAKDALLTTAMIHYPVALARDDFGVYYYVDRLTAPYGGKGFRVFVGKKGAMEQVPLDEVASDSAGEVYSTKRGELRLVVSQKDDDAKAAFWVKGDKKTELVLLDILVNSPIVFRDLGIYSFTGTLCDNI